MTAMSMAVGATAGPLDPCMFDNERRILHASAEWPHHADIDDLIERGGTGLRDLIAAARLPRPHVMYAIGRLEDLGYLPDPSIR